MTIYPKDPQGPADFSIDWSAWLTAGEVISSATWSVAPSEDDAPLLGNTINGDAIQGVYVSGGVTGRRYRLTCHIQTDAGRAADRSITIRIMEQ